MNYNIKPRTAIFVGKQLTAIPVAKLINRDRTVILLPYKDTHICLASIYMDGYRTVRSRCFVGGLFVVDFS